MGWRKLGESTHVRLARFCHHARRQEQRIKRIARIESVKFMARPVKRAATKHYNELGEGTNSLHRARQRCAGNYFTEVK
jgi:hypothetical protein